MTSKFGANQIMCTFQLFGINEAILTLTLTPCNFSQKRPDVCKIVLSIKLRFPPTPPPAGKSVNFEDFLLICTVFPHFGPFWGGVKPNFADKNFMDTQSELVE